MKFVYKPEGADPRTWEFDPTKLMSPEAEAIERNTGMSFATWIEAVGRGSMLAIHGLLYVLLKRSHPTLKWDEVEFCLADVDFEMDDEEKRVLVRELLSKTDRTSDEDEVLQEMIEDGIEPAEDDAGKA